MSGQEIFKRVTQRAVELAADWRDDGPKIPAVPTAMVDELRARFDIGLPDEGRDGEEIVDLLNGAAQNGLVSNTHPNFYAWVQGSSHPVGVAADILTSAWGQNAGIYQTAPAAAIAEEVAGAWLLDLMDLPRESSIAFANGATLASFTCLAAARSEVLRRANYDLEEEGLIGAPDLCVFLGEEGHETVFMDLRYLGIGRKNRVLIRSDKQGRMDAKDLREKIALHNGPKIIIAQAGHINSGAFDPFAEIVKIAKDHDAWVHVDGAFGLWARAVPELAHLTDGIDLADSWTVDGHKWLQIPYDCGFAIVRDSEAHKRAMAINASYLVHHNNDGRNLSHFGPELSRRARGFAVWAVLQAFGRNGLEEMIARHVRCAQYLATCLAPIPGVRILNDVVLNQLAIAFGENEPQDQRDEMTRKVITAIRKENRNFVLGAKWNGEEILRLSVISHLTDESHMDDLAASITRAWEKVQKARDELLTT
jgi:glutamate/tyrosine decarboxylase-like PLP-dependent enzyme